LNNEATSDQPLLDWRQAQESFIPLGKFQQRRIIHPQSYLPFVL